MSRLRLSPSTIGTPESSRNLIIVVRADPIICGHSTEARNLAEAAHSLGFENIHIVSYPIETLLESELPLKPLETIPSYSPGISVDRPEPVGDYKVLDGRLTYAMSGHMVDLLSRMRGKTIIMDLYLVPHGMMVMNAIRTLEGAGIGREVITIGEAVGSDITNVVNNAMKTDQYGAAAMVLNNYLAHDVPVAVSQFTKELIVEAGEKVDAKLNTHFAKRLEARVAISYPAIDTRKYLDVKTHTRRLESVFHARGLEQDGFILFLSRLSRAKGVDDLIHAYQASNLYGEKKLVICGNGPESERLHYLADNDQHIMLLHDVSDDEKPYLMHGCYAYALPSKPRLEFTETFGIAVAEAMLAGGKGPVITTQTGGIPEATGGKCLYHKAGDVADLTDQLDHVAAMSDQEREAFAAEAQAFAQQFGREQVFGKLLELARCKQVA